MDFNAVGLKAGLEVHQQLDTKKLFCRCESVLRDDAPDFVIKRFLRPFSSEHGLVDEAVLDAFLKKQSFVYEAFFDSNCEVELDESPPKQVEKEALSAILEVALMTNSDIFSKIVVMRKAIIDGSNVSGFQRTALVAVNGKISVGGKKVGVQSIVLEEDSARLVEKKESEVVYRIDRLGVPLIELATDPELFSPQEVKAAALEIGKIFRLTGKAKRGLGTIRQDVNVSVREGERVEIKGVQDLENIDKFVENEVLRQLSLVEVKKELAKRGCSKDVLQNQKSVSVGTFSNPSGFLKGKEVFGVRVPFFGSLLGKELSPGRRLGTEFADYVRAKSNAKGIIHSDEDLQKSYGISAEEAEVVSKKLGLASGDGFVLVAGLSPVESKRVLENIVLSRAMQCLVGVPKETRDAIDNFSTKYSRPLAGAARMYPETDLDSVQVPKALVEQLKKNLPLGETQRKDLYVKKFGLSEKLADQMKLSNFARFFEELCAKGFEPKKTAVFLLETLTAAKREGLQVENISRERLVEILSLMRTGRITKELEIEVLKECALKPSKAVEEILKEMSVSSSSSTEVEKVVLQVIEKNRQLIAAKGQGAFSALMGEAMALLKGTASGKQVSDALRKHLK